MNTEPSALAQRLRICADKAGSGDELSRKTAIPRRTLESYLTGESEPKTSRLVAIAEASGVTVEWLATGREPPPFAASTSGLPPGKLHEEMLSEAISIVEDWLEVNRRRMASEKKASIISKLYQLFIEDIEAGQKPLDRRRAQQFLRLVA